MKSNYVWMNWRFTVQDGVLWFVPYWINVLCKFDLSTGKMEKIIKIPFDEIEYAGVYGIRKYEEYIICVPGYENSIFLYNTQSEDMSVIPLRKEDGIYENFFDCSRWQKNFYFFPRDYNYLVKMNLENKAVTYISLKKFGKMFNSCVQMGNKVYLVNKSEYLTIFDMEEEFFERVEVCDNEQLNTIERFHEHELIMSSLNGMIYTYDLQCGEIKKVDAVRGTAYSGIIMAADKLYLFPQADIDKIVILDMENYAVTEIQLQAKRNKNRQYDYRYGVFSQPVIENSIIYVMNASNECLHVINTLTGEVSDVYIELKEMDEELCDYFFAFMQKVGGVQEEMAPYATLEHFLKMQIERDESQTLDVGKKIFEFVKE